MLSPSTTTLFSASAGSGKTHKLVETYLLLCLSSKDPGHYFQVLAITFTRKATSEMKERIVESLISWVDRKPSGASEIMKESIISELSIDENEFLSRAENMLEHLIHHYGYFSVTTIDAFTHRIVRQFSQDLNLPAGFELESEETLLTSDAVDLTLEEYGKENRITSLLKMFAQYRSEESESGWQIRRILLEQVTNLLNASDEKRLFELEAAMENNLFERLEELNKAEKECTDFLQSTCSTALESLDKSGVERSEFSSGTLPNFFVNVLKFLKGKKLPPFPKTIQKLLDKEAEYFKKSTTESRKPFINLEGDKLIVLIEPVRKMIVKKKKIKHIRSELFGLALLSAIRTKLIQIKNDRNIVLMKELGALINKELREQPSAYLFERLGERYHQLFIDEFQDTSVQQWANLQPFTEEITSGNGEVLLVGDAKQAIYRWRGGDVQQFMDIYQAAIDGISGYEKIELQENYRSLPQVVEFNNLFFNFCALNILMDPTHSNLYEAGHQIPKAKGGSGYVEIKRFEGKNNNDFLPTHDDYIINLIKKLTSEDGYNPADIAILYRNKSEASRLIPLLAEEGFQFASEQGQQLESSVQVLFLINLLKLVLDPQDAEAKQGLIHYFLLTRSLTSNDTTVLGESLNKGAPWKHLKKFFPDLEYPDLSLGTYELLLHWIRVFSLEGDSDSYLWAFLGDAINRGPKESTDPVDILKWWNERGKQKTVEQAERKEAIKLMTIHKSKGLQFPVVIVPNCKWKTSELTEDFLWNSLDEQEYAGLSSFPFKAQNWDGIGGELEEKWKRAVRDTTLDNLNLLYVAFTRPKEQLYILSRFAKDEKGSNIASWMQNFFNSQGMPSSDLISFGQKELALGEDSKNNTLTEEISFTSRNWQKDIQLVVTPQFSEEQKFGKDFHESASKCQTIEHWRMLQKNRPEWKEQIETLIHQLQGEEYKIFFLGLPHMNERSITSSEGKTLRPDRIVIDDEGKIHILDYKTGTEKEEHQTQIREYQVVYEEAGYQVGSSKLLYI